MRVAALTSSLLLAAAMACDNEPMTSSAVCDVSTISVTVAVDAAIGAHQTAAGYLVPLVIRASIPCLEGVAHASVTTSAGAFETSATPFVPDAAASQEEAPGDVLAPAGASVDVTLTPLAGDTYVGFTTLQLSGVQLAARIQVALGDASDCETLGAWVDAGSEPEVTITDAGTCSP